MNFLTRKNGSAISDQLPLQVDDVSQATDRVSFAAETVTFNSAAAAGSTGINALDHAPILNLSGDKVGSYWGNDANRRLEITNMDDVGTLTETATAADIVIRSSKALDKLFETASGNRRYILKATDVEGDVLYGWIGDITVSGNTYTIPVHDAVSSGAQSWVGTLADFTTVKRVEIFSYQSSFVWVTGAVLTREVAFDEEMFEKDPQAYFDSLSNGDYGISYRKGAIVFKKVTTGTSDTAGYDSVASTTGSITLDEFPAAAALADNFATPTTTQVGAFGMVYDGSTWDFMRGTAADGVTVNLGANNDVTVTSGAITETNSAAALTALQLIDNAVSGAGFNITQLGGVNVNLGAGAVATGTQRMTLGSDDPAVAALQIMDDWDESDRAKVNPIVGQAGVAAGAGASSATTQRVTEGSTSMLVRGTEDVAGADTYTTLITPATACTHLAYSLQGDYDAILSLDNGVTEHMVLPARSAGVLDALTISASVNIQAKNKTTGSNYANLNVSVW